MGRKRGRMSETDAPEDEGQDETLVETLQLERLELNLFRGTTPDMQPSKGWQRLGASARATGSPTLAR